MAPLAPSAFPVMFKFLSRLSRRPGIKPEAVFVLRVLFLNTNSRSVIVL